MTAPPAGAPERAAGLVMLDLFSGTGGASAAMRARGWKVTTVDVDAELAPDVVADVIDYQHIGPALDLLWASPPCEEISRAILPWIQGPEPSMVLFEAVRRIRLQTAPRFWVIENVHGASRWLAPRFGPMRKKVGPFHLFGCFPPFRCHVAPFKERLSGRQKRERAAIPYGLSDALAKAVEFCSRAEFRS